MLPANGCRFGTAVAAVTPVPGAAYAWSLEGGEFAGGTGTDHVTIALGGGDTAKVSVSVTTANCTSTGTASIALHDAFTIPSFSAGAGLLGQPRTITWTYANGTPSSQILSGTDFAPVTLANDVRSYTYTPLTEGDKSVVLDARSGRAPATGRAHAAGRGTGAASDCNVARAKAAYHIDCNRPDATIIAPATTNAETPFTARVHLDSFATAKWTIANGTPSSATGESVVIKATSNAPVDISVTVAAGACTASATSRVTVDPAFSCDNPAADVVVVARADCSSVVQARFTGKPPFRGTWNDGTAFATNGFSIERPVLAAGTVSVSHFQDALCAGTASNSVAVAPTSVSAVLSVPSGTCANGASVAATFTGTPPFNGTWWDGVPFSTSAHQLSRPVTEGGSISLRFSDATCGPVSSNIVEFEDPPAVALSLDPSTAGSCLPIGTGVKVIAKIPGGLPPFSITWSDGVVQNFPANFIGSFTRTVTLPAAGLTLGITSGHDALCPLKPPANQLSVGATPNATFFLSGQVCASQSATATLSSTPAPGSAISWSLANGTITSGQGTTSIKFLPNTGAGTLSCTITTPRGCSATYSVAINPATAPAAPQPVVTQGSAVPVGTAVTIAWTTEKNTLNSTIDASTAGNPPTSPQCNGSLCSAAYTAKTAGVITFTVHAFGRCGDIVNGSTTLTVYTP